MIQRFSSLPLFISKHKEVPDSWMRHPTSFVVFPSDILLLLTLIIRSPGTISPTTSAGPPGVTPVILLPVYFSPNFPSLPRVIFTEYVELEKSKSNNRFEFTRFFNYQYLALTLTNVRIIISSVRCLTFYTDWLQSQYIYEINIMAST